VVLLYRQLLIVDYEQRAAYAASVGVYANLRLGDVANNADLRVDVNHASELAERLHELLRIAVYSHPVPVDEDLARGRLGDDRRQDVCQVLGAELLKEFHDRHLGWVGEKVKMILLSNSTNYENV
jgi:hypothetical protein